MVSVSGGNGMVAAATADDDVDNKNDSASVLHQCDTLQQQVP